MQNENNISGIYCVENIENNKKYIGQSKNINDRWYKHKNELKRGVHFNDYLQKSWNKYGEEKFEFHILEYCDDTELDKKEIYYIELYNTTNRELGYNLKSGGQNGSSVLSRESRNKLSNSIKESYENNEELREKRRIDAINRWQNPEIKEKIMGSNNVMYGKHHSEESKRKMSENKKGIPSWRRDITPVFCIELNKEFKDSTDAGKKLSLPGYNILRVCRGERKTCGGYHWKFLLGNDIS